VHVHANERPWRRRGSWLRDGAGDLPPGSDAGHGQGDQTEYYDPHQVFHGDLPFAARGFFCETGFPISAFNAHIRKIESDWLTAWDFSKRLCTSRVARKVRAPLSSRVQEQTQTDTAGKRR
jgi:hypothetical protein